MEIRGYQIGPVWVRFVAAAAVVLTAAGCGTVPARVTITDAPKKESKLSEAPIQFQLRQSRIKVQRTTGAEKQTEEKGELKVEDASSACAVAAKAGAVPLAATVGPVGVTSSGDQLPIYWMTGSDDTLSTTDLSVTYIPQTKLISEIGTNVTDNLTSTVSKIGANVTDKLTTTVTAGGTLAAAALPSVLASATVPTAAPPRTKSLEDLACSLRVAIINPYLTEWQFLTIGENQKTGLVYRTFLTPDAGAVDKKEFFADRGRASRIFPVTACAAAEVQIAVSKEDAKADGEKPYYIFSVQVADADRVVPFNIPSKGAIELDPVCGGNVTVEPGAPRDAELKAAADFFKQADAIQKAANPASKK